MKTKHTQDIFDLVNNSSFLDEINELKKFYSQIGIYGIEDYLRILPSILFEKNNENGLYFNEYVSFRAYYLLYLFLCFGDNKFNLNNSYLEEDNSGGKIEILKEYLEINFFNSTSSFTFFNTEIDKTAINEILKMLSNNPDSLLENKILSDDEKKLLLVLDNDFKNILKNTITLISEKVGDENLKIYLIGKLKQTSKNILKHLKKSRLNEIKGVTKEKTNENIK